MNFKITKKQLGQRLDKFLSDSLPDTSRSQIQKLIKQESIVVNDRPVSAHYGLKEGDKVSVLKKKIKAEKKKAEKEEASRFSLSDVKIIENNDEFLIINKPAGLTVHGGEGIRSLTLVDLILKKYPGLKKIGEDPSRPGIVHRLDREVSGLMVLPKTQDSFDNLKSQFQKRTIGKEYVALVYGSVAKEADEINFPLKRSSGGYKMAAMPVTHKGGLNENQDGVRRAITEFEIAERFINYTLLKIRIKTGRTHQIRVHMLAYGHPIVGDNLYSTKKTRELNRKLDLGCIFLVANNLSFRDLSGELRKFEIDLPKELEAVLKKVK